MAKRIEIALTSRPPVSIDPEEWSVIGAAKRHDGGEHEFQANRKWMLKVRQHSDGRTIVSGSYDSNFPMEQNREGGVLLPDSEPRQLVDAILEVARSLDFERALAQECIASLPAEEI